MTFNICMPHECAHMPVIMHMWIADPSKCAALTYHGFSAPLILSPLQGMTTAPCMLPLEARPAHLRYIALPVAKEALLLADGCQRTNDAPAPGGLFEGPSLQPPSCLQQELDPVQRRRQCLPCRANNTIAMMACRQARFLQERSLRPGAISGDPLQCTGNSFRFCAVGGKGPQALPSRKRWVPLCAQG